MNAAPNPTSILLRNTSSCEEWELGRGGGADNHVTVRAAARGVTINKYTRRKEIQKKMFKVHTTMEIYKKQIKKVLRCN